jgi:ribonuclease D
VGQEKKTIPASQPRFDLIETPSAVADFAHKAATAAALAVDVEADSMFHYREKVCLLQMAADGHTVVIDPLKVSALDALKPLFEAPHIQKVFHGADYDVRSLYRDFGITINNLFDTQLASMFLGYAETSLDAVVAHRFGVELDKKYQKKDWSRRPLPPAMVAYAACDVFYLIPLAAMLTRELEGKGRLAWVRESCRLLSQVRPQDNHQPLFMRFRGAGRLTPRQLAALEELLQLRDQLARQKDRPWFKIMGNAALLKIATDMPGTLKRLKTGPALSVKQLDMYGHAILSALEKARAVPFDQLPVYPHRKSTRLSPRIPRRVKALRAWRDNMAQQLALDPALLLNKALLQEIAARKPRTRADLAQTPHIHQWQVDAFGEQILSVLNTIP